MFGHKLNQKQGLGKKEREIWLQKRDFPAGRIVQSYAESLFVLSSRLQKT